MIYFDIPYKYKYKTLNSGYVVDVSPGTLQFSFPQTRCTGTRRGTLTSPPDNNYNG